MMIHPFFISDSVLEDCQSKVNEAMFDMDGTQQQMSVSVTPQLMLSLLERATATSDEFSAAFVHHLTDGDVTGGRQADAIRGANNLTGVVTTILRNAKSFSTLIEGDQDEEEKEGASGNDQNPLATAFRGAAERTRDAFRELQSSQLSKIDLPRRPEKVQEHNGKLQSEFRTLLKAVEELVVKEGAPKPDGRDLVNVVEDELSNASRTIQEAAALLASLLAEDTPRDPKLTQVDLQVHRSLLYYLRVLVLRCSLSYHGLHYRTRLQPEHTGHNRRYRPSHHCRHAVTTGNCSERPWERVEGGILQEK